MCHLAAPTNRRRKINCPPEKTSLGATSATTTQAEETACIIHPEHDQPTCMKQQQNPAPAALAARLGSHVQRCEAIFTNTALVGL